MASPPGDAGPPSARGCRGEGGGAESGLGSRPGVIDCQVIVVF
jgi:hypothetical protein